MNRIPIHAGRFFLWLGLTALALGIFVDITKDLLEGDVDAIDRAILLAIAKARAPLLTSAAVDLSALGSVTLVTLFSAVTLAVLLMLRDRIGSLQLLSASAGAALWTVATKDIIERARPEVVPRLIEVSGFSYPSGHSLAAASLYLTIAIIVRRHLQTAPAQMAILAMAGLLIILVGLSRVYLGVHYPTDVASGVSLGAAWALLLAGGFSLIGRAHSEAD